MTTSRLLTSLLFATTAAACGSSSQSSQPSQAQAQQATDGWAEAHADGWTLTVDEQLSAQEFRFASYSHACPSTSGANFTSVVYEAPGYDVALAFDCVEPRLTDLAALRETFAFAVLNRLPHGLDVNGWKFSVLTPVSSFSEGVELVSLDGGRLTVRIATPLFAITGFHAGDEDCQITDDVPEKCAVSTELNIPLTLTLTAPFPLQLFPNGG